MGFVNYWPASVAGVGRSPPVMPFAWDNLSLNCNKRSQSAAALSAKVAKTGDKVLSAVTCAPAGAGQGERRIQLATAGGRFFCAELIRKSLLVFVGLSQLIAGFGAGSPFTSVCNDWSGDIFAPQVLTSERRDCRQCCPRRPRYLRPLASIELRRRSSFFARLTPCRHRKSR